MFEFNFKTNPVLPAVFDDSLSYLEAISKLNAYFEQIVKQVELALEDFTNDSHEYTDIQIEKALTNFQQLVDNLEANFQSFSNSVSADIANIKSDVDNFKSETSDEVASLKTYTDIKVKENNDEILSSMSEQLSNIKVVNFFNGALIPIQAMFDYLAGLHLTDSITYQALSERNITYTAYAALDITYSQLVSEGNSVITGG